VVYSLEFAPKVSASNKTSFNIAVLLLIAMQWSEFFLFIGDKKDKSGPQRAFGAIAQLYMTHSSVLMGAILSGHHHHGHLSPDLKFSGLLKIFCVILLSFVWLTYAILRGLFAYGHEGEYNHNWIPVSYSWVFWVVCVFGGITCLIFAIRYAKNISNESGLKLIGISGGHAQVESVGLMSHRNGRTHDELNLDGSALSGALDFDVLLIVITFVTATVFYASETFAYQSTKEYLSLAYSLMTPIAAIGLASLAACMWWNPPSSPKWALYFGLLFGLCMLGSLETAEDCHLNSSHPRCCEYPWNPDLNHHMEEPHKAPDCVGMTASDGTSCLTFPLDELTGGVVVPSSKAASAKMNGSISIPILFTGVFETTRGVIIDMYKNGEKISSETIKDLYHILETQSCLTKQVATIANGTLAIYPPGCYGEYVYYVPNEISMECNPFTVGNACTFSVRTLNCAFVPSAPLIVRPVDPTKISADEVQLVDSDGVIRPNNELAESPFYVFFRLVGMAALLECFFTLSGVILKLIFLSECRTFSASRRIYNRKTTVVFQDSKPFVITDDSRPIMGQSSHIEQPRGDLQSLSSTQTIDSAS
jgi:hypothetical protein